jgi:hypothetical protein
MGTAGLREYEAGRMTVALDQIERMEINDMISGAIAAHLAECPIKEVQSHQARVLRILDGNGHDGLVVTVNSIQTTINLIGKWFVFVVIPLMAGTLGMVIWNHFSQR